MIIGIVYVNEVSLLERVLSERISVREFPMCMQQTCSFCSCQSKKCNLSIKKQREISPDVFPFKCFRNIYFSKETVFVLRSMCCCYKNRDGTEL